MERSVASSQVFWAEGFRARGAMGLPPSLGTLCGGSMASPWVWGEPARAKPVTWGINASTITLCMPWWGWDAGQGTGVGAEAPL